MPHPTIIGHRLAWDRDCEGFWFLEGDSDPTVMTEAHRQDLNNEEEDIVLSLDGSGPDNIWVGVIFPFLMDLEGWLIVTDAPDFVDVSTSVNTTDGMDGVWTVLEAPPAGAIETGSGVSEWRDNAYQLDVPKVGIKAIRWRHNGGGTLVGYWLLHLYGRPNSAAGVERLTFWHPTLDESLDGNMLDYIEPCRKSSADLTFRIKNSSLTQVSAGVTVGIDSLYTPTGFPATDGMYLLSEDLGLTFASVVSIGSLAPQQVSSVIILRLVVPEDASLGALLAARLIASGGSVDEHVAYTYLTQITNNTPVPHIWYVYPTSGHPSDPITVVGHGFGETAGDYGGVVKYEGVDQAPTSWTKVDATGAAYGPARVIQSPNDNVNVEHERIDFLVPVDALDGFITVVTNGP